MAKKYKPSVDNKIKFRYNNEKHTGTITFIGEKAVSVYPHTVTPLDPKGNPIDMEWWVENGDIVGKVLEEKDEK
jgi:hypothetical protein